MKRSDRVRNGRPRQVSDRLKSGRQKTRPAAPVAALIRSQPWDSLIPHLLKAQVEPEATLERLRSYARLLLEWNRNVSNLISRHDEARFLERHIAESIEPAAWLLSSGAARWLDFGSGGGLPAIPLAIAGVGKQWTLVESRRTKTLFLRRVVEQLGLSNVHVVLSRLEDLVAEGKLDGSFDAFTSRATLALAPTLALAGRVVAPGGAALLWKGSRREAEMREDRRWQTAWEL